MHARVGAKFLKGMTSAKSLCQRPINEGELLIIVFTTVTEAIESMAHSHKAKWWLPGEKEAARYGAAKPNCRNLPRVVSVETGRLAT